MSKTDYLEHEVLKWCTGQANTLDDGLITPYIALFTTAPTDAGGGTEVSGGSYARVNGAGKFGAPSGGSIANNAAITFPTPTGSWGTIVAYGIFTASTGGTLLRWENMTTAKAVASGDAPSFGSGKIVITET